MHQCTDLGFVGKPGGSLQNIDEILCTVSLHEKHRSTVPLSQSLPLSTLVHCND